MSLEGIVSIAGYGGLFKVISSTKNGIIVESLEDKKRMQAFAHFKISTLTEISIYTQTDNIQLTEVLKKIHEKENKGKTSIDANADSKELKKYFKNILPEYDEERVYVSDIKKVIKWYNTLNEYNMIPADPDSGKIENSTEAESKNDVLTETESKPKKTTKKKSNSKKSETTKSETTKSEG